jgi:drug/metabolite transporter (DMT)-like permease
MTDRSRGTLLLFGFIAAAGVRDVWIGGLLARLGLFEVALLAFGATALLFGLILTLAKPGQLRLLLRHRREVAALNLTTGVAWACYFGALSTTPPAAAALAFVAVGPAVVMVLGRVGIGGQHDGALDPLAAVAYLGTLLLTVALAGVAGPGVALAAVAGMAITIEAIIARRMGALGAGPTALVGCRFLGVAAISGVGTWVAPAGWGGLSPSGLALQTIILLAVLVGPLWLAQFGLALTGPLHSAVVLALGPVTVLVLQTLAGVAPLTGPMALISAVYVILALLGAWRSLAPRPRPVGVSRT